MRVSIALLLTNCNWIKPNALLHALIPIVMCALQLMCAPTAMLVTNWMHHNALLLYVLTPTAICVLQLMPVSIVMLDINWIQANALLLYALIQTVMRVLQLMCASIVLMTTNWMQHSAFNLLRAMMKTVKNVMKTIEHSVWNARTTHYYFLKECARKTMLMELH